MMNHEGSHHEYFQELGALAASGQISEPEFMELHDHILQCEECRSAYADFIDLLHNKLPLADSALSDPSKLSGSFSENSSYRERFLARARKEGLAVSQEPLPDTVGRKLRRWFWPGLGNPQLASLAVAVLLVTIGLLGYSLRQTNKRYQKLAADQAALSRQLSRQSSVANSVPPERSAPILTPP